MQALFENTQCANDDLLCNTRRGLRCNLPIFILVSFLSHICETEIRLVLDFIVKDVLRNICKYRLRRNSQILKELGVTM